MTEAASLQHRLNSLQDARAALNGLHSHFLNAWQPEETIAEWCGRLQRAVEACGDDVMPYEEYSRWRDELDAWRAKVDADATAKPKP